MQLNGSVWGGGHKAYPSTPPAPDAVTRLLALLSLVAWGCAPSSVSTPPASASPAGEPSGAGPSDGWRQHDLSRPPPPRVEPASAGQPPSDAVVLIGADGAGLDNWETNAGAPAPWRTEAGALVAVPGTGAIRTRESFGDMQLHVEWQPAMEPDKDGQNRSNSGIFLADGRYEVQILDMQDNATYADGRAGAIYGQFPPLADASLPPDAWQRYDLFVRMPRFDGDRLLDPARITVVHNGVLVQNNEALPGGTMWLETLPYEPHGPGRISLQDHGSPVRFRNLWVRRLGDRPAPPSGYPGFQARREPVDAARFAGRYDRAGGEGEFVVEPLGDGIGLSMPWRPGVLRMIPVGAATFELERTAGRIAFDLDASGRATGLTMTMGGGTYPATRRAL